MEDARPSLDGRDEDKARQYGKISISGMGMGRSKQDCLNKRINARLEIRGGNIAADIWLLIPRWKNKTYTISANMED